MTTLRRATKDDHDVVVSLLSELLQEVSSDFPGALQIADKLDRHVSQSLNSERCFIALACNPVAIGIARAEMLESHPLTALRDDLTPGYVDQMYVRPGARNQGIGALLLTKCEEWFREKGATIILLHAMPRTLPFYGRAGYGLNQEMFKFLK